MRCVIPLRRIGLALAAAFFMAGFINLDNYPERLISQLFAVLLVEDHLASSLPHSVQSASPLQSWSGILYYLFLSLSDMPGPVHYGLHSISNVTAGARSVDSHHDQDMVCSSR